MTSAKRTDQHRPEVFVPEDYVCVGYFENTEDEGSSRSLAYRENKARLRWLISESKSTAYATGYQCDHCGARIKYVVVQLHIPTGDHLAIGETCAEGRFNYSKSEFDAMRKAAQLDRQAQRILTAWNRYKEEHEADWDALYASTNSFVQDVLRRGRQYGSLSDRQFEKIQEAVARDAERAAQPVAPEPVKVEAPEGRVTVTGTVLALKEQEGYAYNTYVTKMLVLVETPEGQYKVWGTRPTLKEGYVCKGDVVTFSADFTQSHDDASFAFFKRPTKATIARSLEVVKCDERDATIRGFDIW